VRKKWTLIHLSHIRSSKVGDNNAPLAKLQQSISRVEAARAKWSLFQEARGASAWLEVLEWTKYLSAAGQTPKILSALLLLPEMTFTFDARTFWMRMEEKTHESEKRSEKETGPTFDSRIMSRIKCQYSDTCARNLFVSCCRCMRGHSQMEKFALLAHTHSSYSR